MGVPKTHKEAAAKNRHGANLNLSVAEGKHAAARIPAGRDASAENLSKARAARWSDGSSDRKS